MTASKRKAHTFICAYASAVVLLTACGGGGGGGGNDVLSTYVSGFSYNSSTTLYKPWDSLELQPTVTYIKPNAELLFSAGSTKGVSVDAKSGKVTLTESFNGGCAPIQLNWAKTGESWTAEACMDKEYLTLSTGLSKVIDGNPPDMANGIYRFTLSKADLATVQVDVGLTYYDRVKKETHIYGGIFPDGSTTTCAVVDSNLPALKQAIFAKTSESENWKRTFDLIMDWSNTSLGEYQLDFQCTVTSGQKSATHSQSQILKLIQ